MPVTFLGYQLLDFVSNNGQPVKGVKFYFYHDSTHIYYKGYEVENYFADYDRERLLYDIVQKCIPGQQYNLDLVPAFKGKTIIKNLIPVK